MKKMLVILTLISGFVFSQDYEMPGLGLYVGGVMGTIGGELVEELEENVPGAEMSYTLGGPILGVSYATMLGNFPIFMGAGLGSRTGKADFSGVEDSYGVTADEQTISFQYLDFWATMPYPINDSMNLYGGMLFGKALSGTTKIDDEDAEDLEDDALPTGMDYGVMFGLGYALPVMDGALALNIGYALGLATLED
ncbi:MAG: hypothetical protein CMF91_04270, partial [Candidatus Marinimicrobia bacterium]|nr:hypothetical protein [Candidatus Neomarinimicrobiota bacterium]